MSGRCPLFLALVLLFTCGFLVSGAYTATAQTNTVCGYLSIAASSGPQMGDYSCSPDLADPTWFFDSDGADEMFAQLFPGGYFSYDTPPDIRVRLHGAVIGQRFNDKWNVWEKVITSFSSYEVLNGCEPCQPVVSSATFVSDVTVPDGTRFGPSERFVKTWRVRNTGGTTWTTAFGLLHVSGEPFGAASIISIPRAVRPNEEVDLSISLVSPAAPGNYVGRWELSDPQNRLFGPLLTAKITVKASTASATPSSPPAATLLGRPAIFATDFHKLAPDCAKRVNLTVGDLGQVHQAWQTAVRSSAREWHLHSNLNVNGSAAITDNGRALTPVDFKERAMGPLRLARCEVRFVLASQLPKQAVTIQIKTSTDTLDLEQLPMWTQAYADPKRPSEQIASLIIINDRKFKFSTDDSILNPGVYDIATIALHELGHAIGFGHNSDPFSVMNGVQLLHIPQMAGMKRRSLGSRDIEDLVKMYGKSW